MTKKQAKVRFLTACDQEAMPLTYGENQRAIHPFRTGDMLSKHSSRDSGSGRMSQQTSRLLEIDYKMENPYQGILSSRGREGKSVAQPGLFH
jgi:hypothetical protein